MVNTRRLTAAEKAELETLRDRADGEIDLTDPDCPPRTDLSGGIRGAFYRPIKKPVAMRLDADVLDWFEPPRVCRRLVGLSYAAMLWSSSMA
jgi:uncharacterized protein (DUF4415 family)